MYIVYNNIIIQINYCVIKVSLDFKVYRVLDPCMYKACLVAVVCGRMAVLPAVDASQAAAVHGELQALGEGRVAQPSRPLLQPAGRELLGSKES